MKVFDGLNKAQVTLIDIRACLLSTLRSLSLLGFLDGVRDGSLRISVVHVIGSKASFDEIESTAAAVEGAKHHVLLNHTNSRSSSAFRLQWRIRSRSAFLTETAASTVDRKGMGFNSFHADEAGQSRTLRGYVNAWLKPIFWSYDTVALNAL
jgi:hypothetical protein